jgi:Na+/proline symporter
MYLNLDLYTSIGLLLVLAALFTIGGGASAVIWTDFIQTIFMIIGAFILMIISKLNSQNSKK